MIFCASPGGIGKGYLLAYNPNLELFQLKKTVNTMCGANGIGKKKEKDRKTPIGHYKVEEIRKKEESDLSFGGYFILIDYPNKYDRKAGNTGGAIGLHGGRDEETYGCIRILDQGMPDNNTENIRYLAESCRAGDEVIITNVLPRHLVATHTVDKHKYLSKTASDFWKDFIRVRHSKSELLTALGGKEEEAEEELQIGFVKEGTEEVPIRADKDLQGEIVSTMNPKEIVLYLKLEDTNWYYVSTRNGTEGYVHSKYIQCIEPNPSGIGISNDENPPTNVRSAPQMNSKVVATIGAKQRFWYKEAAGDWWKVVLFNGQVGYVAKRLIKPVTVY